MKEQDERIKSKEEAVEFMTNRFGIQSKDEPIEYARTRLVACIDSILEENSIEWIPMDWVNLGNWCKSWYDAGDNISSQDLIAYIKTSPLRK